jgi:glutamate-1-semialdehyde 2,1-aminomutase
MCRIATGRMKIAKASGSYHGTADVLLVGSTILRDPAQWAPPGLLTGADQGVVEIPFNDPDGAEAILERNAADIAAVLIEPVQGSAGMIEATGEYLQRLRDVTTKLGIILIFDEVVTFPVAYGGAQTHFGVMPDLTVMGKVIGGGLPCSAVGGRADLMDLMEPDAHDGQSPMNPMATFGGNQIAMAAGIACLEKLTPQEHDRINALGIKIMEGIDELGRRYDIPLHSSGLGHLIGLHWGPERVVDFRTRLLDDREKVVNIMMALVNEDIYQTYTGMFLLSTAIGEPEVDHFMTTFEKCLHTLGYVS